MQSPKNGTFYWNELLTDDVPKAVAFYQDIMGWEFAEVPMSEQMTYWVAKLDGMPVAGVMEMPKELPEGTPPHWMSYIAVDDVDAEVAKAKAAGAIILNAPFDVPNVGRIAILKDAGNAVIGWMTAAPNAEADAA